MQGECPKDDKLYMQFHILKEQFDSDRMWTNNTGGGVGLSKEQDAVSKRINNRRKRAEVDSESEPNSESSEGERSTH